MDDTYPDNCPSLTYEIRLGSNRLQQNLIDSSRLVFALIGWLGFHGFWCQSSHQNTAHFPSVIWVQRLEFQVKFYWVASNNSLICMKEPKDWRSSTQVTLSWKRPFTSASKRYQRDVHRKLAYLMAQDLRNYYLIHINFKAFFWTGVYLCCIEEVKNVCGINTVVSIDCASMYSQYGISLLFVLFITFKQNKNWWHYSSV